MTPELGGKQYHCPVTENVSDRLVRLPFFNDMTEKELMTVIKTVKNSSKVLR